MFKKRILSCRRNLVALTFLWAPGQFKFIFPTGQWPVCTSAVQLHSTFPTDNSDKISFEQSQHSQHIPWKPVSQPYAPSLPLACLARATFRLSICFPIEGFH